MRQRRNKNDIYINYYRVYNRCINWNECSSNFLHLFKFLSIAIIAALDTVFGGISSVINRNFDLKIFLSGFFGNSILSIALTYLGERLNVDIYLAAIVVFVGRMFTNLAIIRRYYVEKWTKKLENRKNINKAEIVE